MKNILTVIALFVSVVAIGLSSFSLYRSNKIAYVDLLKLHEGFQLTKELTSDIEKIKLTKKSTLDSLKTDYEIAYRQKAAEGVLMNKSEVYRLKEQQYSLELENLGKSYEQRIWTQINTYAGKYGESNHLDIVIGQSGNGNVMFANHKLDITEELIKYCNKEYSGK